MKSVFAASPALLLAAAMFAVPASAQTMAQPETSQPTTMTQPYAGQAMPPQQTAAGRLPQGPYLNECKEVRMLQDTLTAFCPKGDGTWRTTQLVNATGCPGSVQNAGGDLVCTPPVETGSTAAPENYGTSSGGTYGTTPPSAPGYAPAVAAPAMSPYPPAYPAVPSQSYAAPPYYGYGPSPYPPANQYISPSATRAAQPPY